MPLKYHEGDSAYRTLYNMGVITDHKMTIYLT